MRRRTLLLFIVIPLVVLLTIVATVVFHYRSLLFNQTGGESFKGTITAISVDCKNPDKVSSVTVNDKNIIVDPTGETTDDPFGYTDLNLCGVFSDSDSYGTVKKRSGDSITGSWLIGRNVDVNAKKIDDTHYTLKGSNDFYLMGD